MIGRILIDLREYEIELTGTNANLRRLEPPGDRPVRTAANELYNLTTGAWDIAKVQRVIRRFEQERLFDAPASAGTGNTP